MKRSEPRENEMIDVAAARPGGRQVCIMNGPMVLTAPHTSEGQRRFVVVAGTVVLEGGDPVPAHDVPPLAARRRTPLESYRESFVGFGAFAGRG
jgi:hypothetical protein